MPRTEEANQRIREEQRAKLLSAAANVFARKGNAATMAHVACEAGVSQGLAYRYFASKEEIFTILVKQAAESSGGPAERIKQIQGTPGTRLALLISYILEENRQNHGFSQIFSQVLADDKTPNELRRLVERNGKIIQDIMRELIVEGQVTEEIAKDDPDQLMVALMACISGLMKRSTMLDPKDAQKHFPETKIILRMLKPDQKGKTTGMNRKGVCYDVGRVLIGANWRPNFDAKVVHRELEIIKNDLHCNTVRICGLDLDHLMVTSEDALKQGLEVWLSPEMWDRSQEETLQYMTKAATAAEELRQRWPEKLTFSLGSELTLFTQGIVEGNNVFERMNNPSFWENVKAGKHNKPLNVFLAKANEAVRQVFHGKVTYFSVPLEAVDWSIFDFVGVDLYRDARIKDVYGDLVKRFLVYNKPVVIGEFGCCTFQGAEKLGGVGFAVMFGMMAQYLGPNVSLPKPFADVIKIPTKVGGHYVRDENLQARELTDQLSVLDAVGVEGAFVFTFVSPNMPYNEDPRYDLDMASYSLVKSFPEKETVQEMTRQTARQGKELLGIDIDPKALAKFIGALGKHGSTYPDMTWEPKESFKAVADYYR